MDVRTLVRQVQSHEKDVRTNAEEQLRQYGTQDVGNILNALFSFATDASVSDGQTAMLLVKNLVVSYWSDTFSQYIGPTWTDQVKEYVRSKLLNVVAQSDVKILVRDAAESIISRIATLEYPDQWPGLMEETMSLLMNDTTQIAGLTLFKELLNDTFRDQDFWQYGSQIMSRLYYLISDYDDSTQLYALQCFHECMNFFLMGENDIQLQQLSGMAETQLQHWCELFVKILRDSGNHDVLHELIDTLQDLQSGFPEIMSKELPSLLEATFEALQNYGNEKNENQDIIALQLDFAEVALTNSPSVLEHLRQDSDALAKFISICIEHACACKELREAWVEDFNVFITHEQELSLDVWPRPSAGLLVGAIKTENTLSCLIQYLQQTSDWIYQEACLFLISCALQQLPIESQVISSSDVVNLLVFLSKASGGPELLSARITTTSGYVSKYMTRLLDPDSSLGLLKRSADLLTGSPSTNLIKCARLKTASLGCSIYPKDLREYQQTLLNSIASIIPDADDDTPTFLVDCFLEALRLDFDAAIQFNEIFGMFFALVAKGTANLELNAEILNLVGEFMDSTREFPDSQQLVFNQFLTPVMRIFELSQQHGFEYSSDLQFALDICGVVFERCTPQVIAQDKSDLSRLLENLILTCDDPQILQAGSFGYAALIERSKLDELKQEDTQRILEVTAKLLNPKLEDSAALAAGRLVTALLENFTDLGQILGDVFVVAAKRMIHANHAYLVESISLSFAELFIKDCAAALNLLDANGLLEAFLKKWLSIFEVVRGPDELNKYILAMETLFELHDPRVESFQVDDEAIYRPNGIPITRSKGLQFTKAPFPLKIIKLLIHALDETPVPMPDPYEDDDEWADEVVYSLDGSATDTRAFTLIMDWFQKVGQQSMVWYQKLNDSERNILLRASKASGHD